MSGFYVLASVLLGALMFAAGVFFSHGNLFVGLLTGLAGMIGSLIGMLVAFRKKE